jgi:hypothetical protein
MNKLKFTNMRKLLTFFACFFLLSQVANAQLEFQKTGGGVTSYIEASKTATSATFKVVATEVWTASVIEGTVKVPPDLTPALVPDNGGTAGTATTTTVTVNFPANTGAATNFIKIRFTSGAETADFVVIQGGGEPYISKIESSELPGSYHVGDVINIKVTYSGNIDNIAAPIDDISLLLSNGGEAVLTSDIDGNSNTIGFQYTVAVGDAPTDKLGVQSVSVGGTEIRATGGAFLLANHSIKTDYLNTDPVKAIEVDGILPVVTIIDGTAETLGGTDTQVTLKSTEDGFVYIYDKTLAIPTSDAKLGAAVAIGRAAKVAATAGVNAIISTTTIDHTSFVATGFFVAYAVDGIGNLSLPVEMVRITDKTGPVPVITANVVTPPATSLTTIDFTIDFGEPINTGANGFGGFNQLEADIIATHGTVPITVPTTAAVDVDGKGQKFTFSITDMRSAQ